MVSSKWKSDQHERINSAAEAPPPQVLPIQYRARLDGLAALKNASLMTGNRTLLSEANCCDRAYGKGAG